MKKETTQMHQAMWYCVEIATGIELLWKHKIIHTNLTLDNILFENWWMTC